MCIFVTDCNWWNWGPIEIWRNCSSVFRLLGTCLDTQIFKIGLPVQKLHLHIHFFVKFLFLLLVSTNEGHFHGLSRFRYTQLGTQVASPRCAQLGIKHENGLSLIPVRLEPLSFILQSNAKDLRLHSTIEVK